MRSGGRPGRPAAPPATSPPEVADLSSAVGKTVSAFPPLAAQGRELTVSLASGSTAVSHGLGRPVRGWLVLRQRKGAAMLYEEQSDARVLRLNASAATEVTLWLF